MHVIKTEKKLSTVYLLILILISSFTFNTLSKKLLLSINFYFYFMLSFAIKSFIKVIATL